MPYVECPNPAYYRIMNSELLDKILEKKESIHLTLLYSSLFADKQGERIVEWAEEVCSGDAKSSERTGVAKDILELYHVWNQNSPILEEFGKMLIEHPSFLARLALGRNLLSYKKYGFSNRRSLEEAITSFCIGEREIIDSFGRDYYWRTGDLKNHISLNVHGDLYAAQADVSGSEQEVIEEDLFGRRKLIVFDTKKEDVAYTGISAYQDWSTFLLSILRYAQSLGKSKMPEIVDWKDVMSKAGVVGTHTAEAEFGLPGSDYYTKDLMDMAILREDIQEKNAWPLNIRFDGEIYYIPYIKNEEMFYLSESEKGDVSLERFGKFFEGKRFSKRMKYCEEDIPHVLRANYKFFARDKTIMFGIMDAFLAETSA